MKLTAEDAERIVTVATAIAGDIDHAAFVLAQKAERLRAKCNDSAFEMREIDGSPKRSKEDAGPLKQKLLELGSSL